MITPETLVAREVHYCVSSLVSTLASGYGAPHVSRDLEDLAEQAMELCGPILDYVSAASDLETWKRYEGEADIAPPSEDGEWWYSPEAPDGDWYPSAQELIEGEGLEPYEREVFEHWIVSDWLADKLAEKGEKVDEDFAGMTVWARTTTGQGIASDWVIEQIVAELNA